MGDRPSPAPNQQWFDALVTRCQTLAGLAIDGDAPALGRHVRNLAPNPPATLPVQQRLATWKVLMVALARTARSAGIERRPEMGLAFLEWAAVDIAGEHWDSDVRRLVERCAEYLDALAADGAVVPASPRVLRALAIIGERYGESSLSLKQVARESEQSPWYLARVLKQETGAGFRAHLERMRIAAARRLLAEGILSVKAIAHLAGFGSSTQLDRAFKRQCGLTPIAFRSAAHQSSINRKN